MRHFYFFQTFNIRSICFNRIHSEFKISWFNRCKIIWLFVWSSINSYFIFTFKYLASLHILTFWYSVMINVLIIRDFILILSIILCKFILSLLHTHYLRNCRSILTFTLCPSMSSLFLTLRCRYIKISTITQWCMH
jgi:hypothetical protein